MMRKTIGVTSVLALGAVIAALVLAADSSSSAEKAAQQSAQSWLALIDAGKYGQSWSEAAQLFKQAVPQAQWESAARGAREPLGRLQSRKLQSSDYRRSLPGAPDGEYVVIQYATSFENKKSAIETITPMKDKDGVWRVSGYYIK
jgi:Protein of unknown function (DUF4019)